MSLKLEIKTLFSAASDSLKDVFFESSFSPESQYAEEEEIEFNKLLESKGIRALHVDNFGGEGCGDDYWSVYKFSSGTESVYVKFNGWYQSYNGSEFDDWFFVDPVEVQVTQYKKSQ